VTCLGKANTEKLIFLTRVLLFYIMPFDQYDAVLKTRASKKFGALFLLLISEKEKKIWQS